MGLKFLRDGMNSANLVAMYSVRGQGMQSTSDEIIEIVPKRDAAEHKLQGGQQITVILTYA